MPSIPSLMAEIAGLANALSSIAARGLGLALQAVLTLHCDGGTRITAAGAQYLFASAFCEAYLNR